MSDTSSEASSLCNNEQNINEEEENNNNPIIKEFDPSPPPDYSSVLLEELLSVSRSYPTLFPDELNSSVVSLLSYPTGPPDHPHRTYHRLERSFVDGGGCYEGELDHKGRRCGVGWMRYKDTGDRYQGSWSRGLRSGSGCYFWCESGSVYCGGWEGGERNGWGHFVYGTRRILDLDQSPALPVSSSSQPGTVVLSGFWSGDRIKTGGQLMTVGGEEGEVIRADIKASSNNYNSDKNNYHAGKVWGAFKKLWISE